MRSGIEHHRENSIIRRDEEVPAGCRQDRTPRTAYAGVDHDHVDGALGEIRPGFSDDKGGLGNIVGRDIMADIDDASGGGDARDDAFHDPHKVVGMPEIRGKSDQPIRHVLIRL